jgi:signal transduction histidine kinase
MKLTAKLTLALLLGVLVLIVAAETLSLRHENEQMNQEMRADAAQLAETISRIVEPLWIMGNRGEALQALQRIDRLSDAWRVRIVQLDVTTNHADAPLNPAVLGQDLRGIFSDYYCDDQGQEHLCTYSRLQIDLAPGAAIEVAEPVRHPDRNSVYYAWHALILMGATTMLGAVLAVALGGAWVGRPLRSLIEKTRRIGEGDLSGPVMLHRRDEFGELADAINSMCEQLRMAQGKIAQEAQARVMAVEQLRHADRLRTVGRLAAGIAHELGTPLNVVSGRAGLIASGRLSPEDVHASALAIKSEAERITAIIRQLLDFARRNTPQRKCVDLNEVMRRTQELLQPIAEKRRCTFQLDSRVSPLMMQLDAGQIQQLFTNLLVNASEAMPQGGPVEVVITTELVTPPPGSDRTPTSDRKAGTYARVDVRDQGEGMTPEVMDQIFEPFFTTKQVGEGTGLGLSIAYGIVQEHGGWIDVRSEQGKGSCFSVFLPVEVGACQDVS